MNVRYRYFKVLLLVLLGCALQGCGGDDSGDAAADAPSDEPDIDVEVAGSVGDGPVANAAIKVYARGGALLQNVVGSQLAGYNVTLKTKGRNFPLLLEATGGTDLVTNLPPDFVLKSSALEPGNRVTANLNPFTTLARATAEQMGDGPTSGNLRTALASVTAEFNSGLTTLAAGGVMSTTINDSNLPEIVKSSETLAEILRRVNAVRRASGRNSTDRRRRQRCWRGLDRRHARRARCDSHRRARVGDRRARERASARRGDDEQPQRQRPTGHGCPRRRDQPPCLGSDHCADRVAADHRGHDRRGAHGHQSRERDHALLAYT